MKWADWLIVKETDSYFDLTDNQNKDLKDQVQKNLRQVKKENFPLIAKLLRKAADQVASNKVTLEVLNQFHLEAQKTLGQAFHQFQPTALEFALKASPEQIEYFKKRYAKETEKHASEVSTDKAKFKLHKKKFEKWTDEWLSGLTPGQREALDAHIKAHPFPWDLQIRSRDFSLKAFLDARGSRATLQKYMDKMEDDRDPEYQKALQAYQIHLKNFILDLYLHLTSDQKNYLLQKLRSRAQEFEVLARDPP